MRRPLLIADVAPDRDNLEGQRVLRRACFMAARGGGTVIAPFGVDGPLTVVGARHLELKLPSGVSGARLEAAAAEATRGFYREFGDRVVHVLGVHLGLPALMGRGARGKVLVEPGVTPAQRLRDERPDLAAARLTGLVGVENKTARAADALITRTPVEAATWVKRGVEPSKVHVVHDAIEADAPAVMPQMPRLALIGGSGPGQGMSAALSGISRVPGLWRLLCLTPLGFSVGPLQRRARQLKIEQRVDFERLDSSAAARLAGVQLIVSGLSDGRRSRSGAAAPVGGLWALAARRPYVGPDLPLTRAVVGAAGLFVEPEDPAQVADAVGRLLGSESLRESLANAAGERFGRTVGASGDAVLGAVWDSLSLAVESGDPAH